MCCEWLWEDSDACCREANCLWGSSCYSFRWFTHLIVSDTKQPLCVAFTPFCFCHQSSSHASLRCILIEQSNDVALDLRFLLKQTFCRFKRIFGGWRRVWLYETCVLERDKIPTEKSEVHTFPQYYVVKLCRNQLYTHLMCRDYSKTYARAKYFDEVKPWNERCDVAFPCASQNEVDQADAINLVNAGCRLLVEGRGFLYYFEQIVFRASRFFSK